MSAASLVHFRFDPQAVWIAVGVFAQSIFAARFVVQWLASERARTSVIPSAFWHLSLLGGLALLIYAIYRRDPVFIMGQTTGVLIYARNLVLQRRRRPGDDGRMAP